MMNYMKWLKSFLAEVIHRALFVSLLCAFASSAFAVEKIADRMVPARYSMAGIRLGIWADMAEKPGPLDGGVAADPPGTGFCTELFFDYRVAPQFLVEFSVAVASRGEVVLTYNNDDYIGTINIYPILVQAKLSPLATARVAFQPFILAGGGLAVGRYTTQYIRTADPYFDRYFAERTETEFLGVLGGGIDIPIAEQLGISIASKYHPIRFNGTLAGLKDYSGLSVSVGIAYYIHKK